MSMVNESSFLLVGTVLFLIGLLGGGSEIGNFKMPSIDKYWRWLSALIGITCMGIATYGSLKSTSPLPNPTASTPTPTADSGWITISGVVRDASGAPLAGEKVGCEICSGTRFTRADGTFSYGPVLLRDSDTVIMWVFPSSYDMQSIERSGLETRNNPNFDFVFSQVATPEHSTDVEGGLGWITISGIVHDASGTPLPGELVYCQLVTVNPIVYSSRNTNANGSFSCSPIFLREDDMLSVQVLAGGYLGQEIKRSGAEVRYNPYFDFVFSQLVTPTPYLPYDPLTPTTPLPTTLSTAPTSAMPLLTNEDEGFALRYPVEYQIVLYNRTMCFSLSQSDGVLGACHVASAILGVQDADGRTLAKIADELAAPSDIEVSRTNIKIGGEDAILLDNIYVYDVLRQLVVIHENRIYVFTFAPWAAGMDEFQQLERLYSILTESFIFLDKP